MPTAVQLTTPTTPTDIQREWRRITGSRIPAKYSRSFAEFVGSDTRRHCLFSFVVRRSMRLPFADAAQRARYVTDELVLIEHYPEVLRAFMPSDQPDNQDQAAYVQRRNAISNILTQWALGPTQDSTEQVLRFIEHLASDPADFWTHVLEYHAGPPSEEVKALLNRCPELTFLDLFRNVA